MKLAKNENMINERIIMNFLNKFYVVNEVHKSDVNPE